MNSHLIRHNGLNILLDVPTGAVHLLDNVAAAVYAGRVEGQDLDTMAAELTFAWTDLQQAWTELDQLIEQGLLFSSEPVWSQRPGGGLFKAMCLHVAHDCDLRCRYCFAGTGSFGGSRGMMSVDVAQRAVDLLMSSCGQSCELDFFGGEPLLNLGVVEHTAAYARQQAEKLGKKLNLTLTTNAHALSSGYRERLLKLDLDLVLSHDGRQQVHDEMRPGCDGQGSYQVVTDNIISLLERIGSNHYIRGTYTANNPDFVRDIEHWLDLGFRRFSLEPVVAPANSKLALTPAHLPQLQEQYWQLAELALDRESFLFFHFLVDWDEGPCGAKRAAGCGAGLEYLAVAPDGTLFPCHQFVGQPQWQVGDVFSGITKHQVRERFAAADLSGKEQCRQCWARYYCGGGCHANAWWANEDLLKPWDLGCELLKIRMEAALYVKVRQTMNQQITRGDESGETA